MLTVCGFSAFQQMWNRLLGRPCFRLWGRWAGVQDGSSPRCWGPGWRQNATQGMFSGEITGCKRQALRAHLWPVFVSRSLTFKCSKKVPGQSQHQQGRDVFHPQQGGAGSECMQNNNPTLTASLRPACAYLRVRDQCSGRPLFIVPAIISFLFSLSS